MLTDPVTALCPVPWCTLTVVYLCRALGHLFLSCHNCSEGISDIFSLHISSSFDHHLLMTSQSPSPRHLTPKPLMRLDLACPIPIGTWIHFSCRWKWPGSYIGVKVLGPLKLPLCLCQPCLEITTWKWRLPVRYVQTALIFQNSYDNCNCLVIVSVVCLMAASHCSVSHKQLGIKSILITVPSLVSGT
jgi:hypothetical protein